MNEPRKTNPVNSGALETAEEFQETMSRDNSFDVVEDETDDSAKGSCPMREITNEDNGNNGDCNGNDEAPEKSQNVVFESLCENMDIRLTRTTKLERYSQNVLNAITRKMKHTILLVGDDGCGKRTVVDYLAYRIVKGRCADVFVKHKTAIYKVDQNTIAEDEAGFVSDVNDILAYAELEGVENVIVYFENICDISEVFRSKYSRIISMLNLNNFLNFKFLVIFNDGHYMSECEEQELADFFDEYAVLIKVESEDDSAKILRVLKIRIEELEIEHGVTFPEDVREVFLMCYYGRNFHDNINYRGFLCEVDAMLALVKASGRNIVIREDIKSFYRKSFEIMSKLTDDYNRVTAIHESGHILLSLTISKMYKLYGASMLYDANSGIEAITMLKKTDYVSYDESDMVSYISMVLAGRVAEMEFCVKHKMNGFATYRRLNINKGSGDDIRTATYELREWVMRNGAYKLIGYNLYNDEYSELSVEVQRKVDIIVKWLLAKAFRRAKAIIRENKAFIMEMQSFLLKNCTATRAEILCIAKRTINK